MTPPVRVLLVDDDLFVRTELAELLAGQDGLELIGVCADGRAAVQAAETLKPDVILMDIQLPHLNGAQATRAICQRNPDQIVLALTSLAGDQLVDLMLDAGARGYLVKSTRVSAMAHAIRAAAEGLAVLPVRNREVAPSATNHPVFTDADSKVIRLIAEGYTNRQISAELYVSISTVKRQINGIMKALGVSSRAQIAHAATQHQVPRAPRRL
ncbi:MAG: response regulator transcription factor [Propionicimonas sp.]